MKTIELTEPFDHAARKLKDMDADAKFEQVVANFLHGAPPEASERYLQKVGKSNGGWGGGMNMFAEEGTPRMSHTADTLFSYAMPLAFRTAYGGAPFVIVNGDGSPSMQTSKHQRVLRDLLKEGHVIDNGAEEFTGNRSKTIRPKVVDLTTKLPHAFIPFSILRRPMVELAHVIVIATTPDFVRKIQKPDREKGGMKTVTLHYLGETVFKSRRSGRVYVCGLDRNDDPASRMFYLARLPRSEVDPLTVDEALARLRPEGLPKSALRQGEWFFVPEPKHKAPAKEVVKAQPIVSDKPNEQGVTPPRRGREDRHVATQMHLNGAVHVRGQIKDDEHDTLKLGDVWHRVVKNNADEGWRYDKAAGVSVD